MSKKRRTIAAITGALGAIALIGMTSSSATAQSLFGSSPAPAEAAAGAAAATGEAAASAATSAARAVAKKPVKKKVAASRDASKVNVVNKRSATLVELSVTSKSAASAQPQIVASGLIAGKRKTSNLAKRGGCIYDVSGEFDDESTIEVAGMDLCKDTTINLVE